MRLSAEISAGYEETFRPVSYTHLDVYKRQPADLPGNSDAAVVKPDHRSVMLQGSIYIQTAAAFVVPDRVSKYIPEGAE